MLINRFWCAYCLFNCIIFLKVNFFIFFEQRFYFLPPRKENKGTLGIAWPRHYTQRSLMLGVKSGYSFIFDLLWHFVTKCDRYYYKMRQPFYHKMRQKFIKKCVRFFIDKMRQLLQNTWILLQNSSSQKGNEDDTFYRGYMRISKFIFSV